MASLSVRDPDSTALTSVPRIWGGGGRRGEGGGKGFGIQSRRDLEDMHTLGPTQHMILSFFRLKAHLHPEDVEALTLNVLNAHVNDALDAKKGTRSGHGDTVLPRTRLGDKALLSEALCQKDLGCVGASIWSHIESAGGRRWSADHPCGDVLGAGSAEKIHLLTNSPIINTPAQGRC